MTPHVSVEISRRTLHLGRKHLGFPTSRRSNFVISKRPQFAVPGSDCRRKSSFVISASFSEASTSLATYNLEFRRKHSLFEKCLVEVVRNLDKAPFLQSIEVSNEVMFRYKSVKDEREENLNYDMDSDIFILCQRISKLPKARSLLQLPAPSTGQPEQYIAGKLGECCETEEEEMESEENEFWGLVIKSCLFPGMQGCFLLRTSRASDKHSGCDCIHYSLRKVSAGVPLSDQYDASWLV